MELLRTGFQRTKKYRLTAQVRYALDTYERDFKTTERVRKGNTLKYTNPDELQKSLSLELTSNNSGV